MPQTPAIYWISSPAQIRALESPMRQEIVDGVCSLGRCTISDIAEHLGRAADSLYFHVRKLERVGLLVEVEKRREGKYLVAVYETPGKQLRIRYASGAVGKSVQRVVAGAMRLSLREFGKGIASGNAEFTGNARNVWGARNKGWVSSKDLERMNELLEELSEILHRSGPGEGRTMQSLAWIAAPVRISERAKVRAKAPDVKENVS